MRSFTSSLRVAELVWNEGTLIKDYPPESYEIKCMDDTWEYLKTENAVPKFESYIRGWMKQIQELLLESEQLRLETDDAGPQVSLINFYLYRSGCKSGSCNPCHYLKP